MIIKVMKLDEVTKKVSVDIEEKVPRASSGLLNLKKLGRSTRISEGS